MDHVVVRMGEQEQVYGTVESTPQGLRYEAETPEQLEQLVDLIAALRDGQDTRDSAPYAWLPNDEFLRRLPGRFSGFFVWAALVEDSGYPEQPQTDGDVARAAEAFWADPKI